MFTGIVEEIGIVERVKKGSSSAEIRIKAEKVLEGTEIGDSIAVNGVCLTVVRMDSHGFCADVMHETLNRSNLSRIGTGNPVNLERAMRADGRFGGHMVTGHVDGMGKIVLIRQDDNAVWYTFEAVPEVLRYVVEKGAITIDGISLTVANVSEKDFSVSTIPHTGAVTTLGRKRSGDTVNLEVDILGKYVEKLMHSEQPKAVTGGGLTREFLLQAGF